METSSPVNSNMPSTLRRPQGHGGKEEGLLLAESRRRQGAYPGSLRNLCWSPFRSIPRFDLAQIDVDQIVPFIRLATDMGIHLGLMQIRQQIPSLYARCTLPTVADIWRRARHEDLDTIFGPLEDVWPGFLASNSLYVVVQAMRTTTAYGLDGASAVARRMVEDRLRRGEFKFGELDDAINAIGGTNTKAGGQALDNAVAKLTLAHAKGTALELSEAIKEMPLSAGLKRAVTDRIKNPLGQDRPTLGKL